MLSRGADVCKSMCVVYWIFKNAWRLCNALSASHWSQKYEGGHILTRAGETLPGWVEFGLEAKETDCLRPLLPVVVPVAPPVPLRPVMRPPVRPVPVVAWAGVLLRE